MSKKMCCVCECIAKVQTQYIQIKAFWIMRRQNETEQQPEAELVECINGILRVTKSREENYFRILDFIKKNMESLSKQMDQITIVHKFLNQIDEQQTVLLKQEEVLIVQHSNSAAHCKKYASAYYRLIGRMSARLFELYENSIERIQGTIFYTAKIQDDFNFFRHSINRSLSAERINFNMAATLILKYSKSKYKSQIERLRKFILRIQGGVDIDLRQYYLGTDDYDSDRSPDKQERDTSLKKRTGDKNKNNQASRQKNKKQMSKFSRFADKDEQSPRHSKPATINKIMKLYNVLDPSKTQFLQDMIYNQSEEVHRTRLLSSLWEKNRAIDDQIKQYHKKVEFAADKIKDLQKHFNKPLSDCEGSDHNSGGQRGRSGIFRSEANIKTNGFIISKPKDQNNFKIRKSRRQLLEQQQHTDFVINSAGQYSSGAQYASDGGGAGSGAVTDRNMGNHARQQTIVRRPVTRSLLKKTGFGISNFASRPTSRDQSRKEPDNQPIKLVSKGSTKNRIFVVKSPTLFQDENLHSRMVTNTGRVVNKKQPQVDPNKARGGRPSIKKMSRSLLVREQKIEKVEKPLLQSHIDRPKSIFQQKGEEKMIFDPEKFRQLGGRKEFNLRTKKHMKKSALVSDRLFIEQTNQQINAHNF